MPNQHKTPLLGWHAPAGLAAWARSEAERKGVPLADILTEALTAYRDAQAGQDSDMPAPGNGNGSGPHE